MQSGNTVFPDLPAELRQQKLSFPIRKIRTVLDTDTFNGYFLASLLRGKAIQDAMDLAAKAAAITVSRPGAASSIPELAEVLPS